MKKIYSIPAAVLLVAAMAACTENIEPDAQPQPAKQITITATTSQPQTRVEYKDELGEGTDGQVALKWKEGDTFEVIPFGNPNTRETFTLAGDGGTATGSFTGTLPQSDYNSWVAVYPSYDMDWTTQQQTHNANMEHLADYHRMYGEVIGAEGAYSINFNHETALMKFLLTLPEALADGEELQSLTLSADQDNWLIRSSSFTNTLGNSLTLGLNEVTPEGNTITAYMMIYPSGSLQANKTLTITLETNQRTHAFQHKFSQQMTYARGKAYTATIGAADWTTYTDNMKFTVRPTAANQQFQLPFDSGTGEYTLLVDWGDGNMQTIAPGTSETADVLKHTYKEAGKEYPVTLYTTQAYADGKAQMPQWYPGDYSAAAPMLYSLDTPILHTAQTSLVNFFINCTSLTSIPADLFANNTQATSFYSCFSGCTSLTSIPADLFANNTQATNFSHCFYNCTGLTSIPDDLFANNTQATYFWECFSGCTQATLHPDIFGKDLSHFAGKIIDFERCFQNTGSVLDDAGTAPALWDIADSGNFDPTDCFTGCDKVSNWKDIPFAWGGPQPESTGTTLPGMPGQDDWINN